MADDALPHILRLVVLARRRASAAWERAETQLRKSDAPQVPYTREAAWRAAIAHSISALTRPGVTVSTPDLEKRLDAQITRSLGGVRPTERSVRTIVLTLACVLSSVGVLGNERPLDDLARAAGCGRYVRGSIARPSLSGAKALLRASRVSVDGLSIPAGLEASLRMLLGTEDPRSYKEAFEMVAALVERVYLIVYESWTGRRPDRVPSEFWLLVSDPWKFQQSIVVVEMMAVLQKTRGARANGARTNGLSLLRPDSIIGLLQTVQLTSAKVAHAFTSIIGHLQTLVTIFKHVDDVGFGVMQQMMLIVKEYEARTGEQLRGPTSTFDAGVTLRDATRERTANERRRLRYAKRNKVKWYNYANNNNI